MDPNRKKSRRQTTSILAGTLIHQRPLTLRLEKKVINVPLYRPSRAGPFIRLVERSAGNWFILAEKLKITEISKREIHHIKPKWQTQRK